jgi:hypothetical protein
MLNGVGSSPYSCFKKNSTKKSVLRAGELFRKLARLAHIAKIVRPEACQCHLLEAF